MNANGVADGCTPLGSVAASCRTTDEHGRRRPDIARAAPGRRGGSRRPCRDARDRGRHGARSGPPHRYVDEPSAKLAPDRSATGAISVFIRVHLVVLALTGVGRILLIARPHGGMIARAVGPRPRRDRHERHPAWVGSFPRAGYCSCRARAPTRIPAAVPRCTRSWSPRSKIRPTALQRTQWLAGGIRVVSCPFVVHSWPRILSPSGSNSGSVTTRAGYCSCRARAPRRIPAAVPRCTRSWSPWSKIRPTAPICR